MEQRNFSILIASICVGLVAVMLSFYNFAIMGIDPVEYIENKFTEGDEGETVVTIKGSGVKEEFELSLSDLKSNNYLNVEDRKFHFVNAIGREYDDIYSGASL